MCEGLALFAEWLAGVPRVSCPGSSLLQRSGMPVPVHQYTPECQYQYPVRQYVSMPVPAPSAPVWQYQHPVRQYVSTSSLRRIESMQEGGHWLTKGQQVQPTPGKNSFPHTTTVARVHTPHHSCPGTYTHATHACQCVWHPAPQLEPSHAISRFVGHGVAASQFLISLQLFAWTVCSTLRCV
jgi:hypothetical protein